MVEEQSADLTDRVIGVFDWATRLLRFCPEGRVPPPIAFAAVVILVIALSFVVAIAAVLYVFIGLPWLFLVKRLNAILFPPADFSLEEGPRF